MVCRDANFFQKNKRKWRQNPSPLKPSTKNKNPVKVKGPQPQPELIPFHFQVNKLLRVPPKHYGNIQLFLVQFRGSRFPQRRWNPRNPQDLCPILCRYRGASRRQSRSIIAIGLRRSRTIPLQPRPRISSPQSLPSITRGLLLPPQCVSFFYLTVGRTSLSHLS